MSREFDALLKEEMEHEDFMSIVLEDNDCIDGFYPADDKEFCSNILKDIDLDDDITKQLNDDEEFNSIINQPLEEVL